ATVGGDPMEPGLAPIAAVQRIWHGQPLQMAEIMEAYAVQAIAVVDGAGIDPAVVNPGGGGIARGHPVGASGAVLAVRLFHGLMAGRGLAAIAAAGGIGTALLLSTAREE
ncbi:MAG TPA: thiolase family protein, partial [Tabrizicola sp.]|nr:thiolase family protein [Tabrizicola sp.]